MPKKIRVLMISTSYPNPLNLNAGIFIHNLVKALVKHNCEIKVFCPIPLSFLWKYNECKSIPDTMKYEGIQIHFVRYRRIPSKYGHSISTYLLAKNISNKLLPIIDDFNPNIIHAHWATPSGFVGVYLKKFIKVPIVCNLMGCDINTWPSYDMYSDFLTRKVINKSDRIISVSKSLKRKAETLGKPKCPINVVYMGIDTKDVCYDMRYREIIRKQYNISEQEKIIMFIGNIITSKGIWELLKVFRKIDKENINVKLFLIGSGKELNRAKHFCKINRINHRVEFIGRVMHKEIGKWLSACDIFVLPSYTEGLPNAVVEAMACRRPVIATQVGGIPEIIVNNKNGILVPLKDVQELYSKIMLLCKNNKMAEELGNAGYNTVIEKINWDKRAEQITNIYKKILKYNLS